METVATPLYGLLPASHLLKMSAVIHTDVFAEYSIPREQFFRQRGFFYFSDDQNAFFFCSVHVGAERGCKAVFILFASAAVLFGKCKPLPREHFEKHP